MLNFSFLLPSSPGTILWDELDWISYVCAAHRLQNSVKDAIVGKHIQSLLAASRKLVGHFKHSALKTSLLDDKQRELGVVQPKHVVQDVQTRWNSSFFMLKRLTELQIPIQLILGDMPDKDRRNLDLTANQWALARQILELLEAIDAITTKLSGQQYVTISWYLPLLTALRRQCTSEDDDDSLPLSDLKDRLGDSLARRFHLLVNNSSSVPVLAAALDPRFRDLASLSAEEREEVQEELVAGASGVEPTSPPESCEPCPKKKMTPLDLLLGDEANEPEAASVLQEVKMYMGEPPAKRSVDPLQWWSLNLERFPRLALLAKKYLCIPATSTPSERVFSTAGLVVDKRRSALTPAIIDAIVFLNRNAKLLNLTKEDKACPEPQLILADPTEDLPPLPTL